MFDKICNNIIKNIEDDGDINIIDEIIFINLKDFFEKSSNINEDYDNINNKGIYFKDFVTHYLNFIKLYDDDFKNDLMNRTIDKIKEMYTFNELIEEVIEYEDNDIIIEKCFNSILILYNDIDNIWELTKDLTEEYRIIFEDFLNNSEYDKLDENLDIVFNDIIYKLNINENGFKEVSIKNHIDNRRIVGISDISYSLAYLDLLNIINSKYNNFNINIKYDEYFDCFDIDVNDEKIYSINCICGRYNEVINEPIDFIYESLSFYRNIIKDKENVLIKIENIK